MRRGSTAGSAARRRSGAISGGRVGRPPAPAQRRRPLRVARFAKRGRRGASGDDIAARTLSAGRCEESRAAHPTACEESHEFASVRLIAQDIETLVAFYETLTGRRARACICGDRHPRRGARLRRRPRRPPVRARRGRKPTAPRRSKSQPPTRNSRGEKARRRSSMNPARRRGATGPCNSATPKARWSRSTRPSPRRRRRVSARADRREGSGSDPRRATAPARRRSGFAPDMLFDAHAGASADPDDRRRVPRHR